MNVIIGKKNLTTRIHQSKVDFIKGSISRKQISKFQILMQILFTTIFYRYLWNES